MDRITLSKDYKDLLSAFNEENVEYLIVGAHALAYYGYFRATAGFDVWVHPSAENASRVYKALAAFGAPLSDTTKEEFASDDLIFQIGVAPLRIDVITSISGVEWEDAWPFRVQFHYGEIPVSLIGREELIKNKRASARPKDLLDVQALEKLSLDE